MFNSRNRILNTRGRHPTVRGIVEDLRRAKRDSRIAGVLVIPSGLDAPYWAKLQEILENTKRLGPAGRVRP